jgi:hypothetical protein
MVVGRAFRHLGAGRDGLAVDGVDDDRRRRIAGDRAFDETGRSERGSCLVDGLTGQVGDGDQFRAFGDRHRDGSTTLDLGAVRRLLRSHLTRREVGAEHLWRSGDGQAQFGKASGRLFQCQPAECGHTPRLGTERQHDSHGGTAGHGVAGHEVGVGGDLPADDLADVNRFAVFGRRLLDDQIEVVQGR